MKKIRAASLLLLGFPLMVLASCGQEGGSSPASSVPPSSVQEEDLTFDSFFEKLDRNFTFDISYAVLDGNTGSYGFRFIDEKNGIVTSSGVYQAYSQSERGIMILDREEGKEFSPYRLYSPNGEIDIYDLFFEGYDSLKTLGKEAWEDCEGFYTVKKEQRKEVAFAASVILEAGLEKEDILQSSTAMLYFEGTLAHWDGTFSATFSDGVTSYNVSVSYNFTFSALGTTSDPYLERYLENPTEPKKPSAYHEEILSSFENAGLSLPWVEGFSIGFAQSEGAYEGSYEITDCLSSLEFARRFASSLLEAGYAYMPSDEDGEGDFDVSSLAEDVTYSFKASSEKGMALIGILFCSEASLTEIGKALFPDGLLSITAWVLPNQVAAE